MRTMMPLKKVVDVLEKKIFCVLAMLQYSGWTPSFICNDLVDSSCSFRIALTYYEFPRSCQK